MEKNKKEIRREALRRRDGLTAGQRRDYSARIAESLTGLSCYREADAVLAYISFRSEADTFLLLERAFADEKAVQSPPAGKALGNGRTTKLVNAMFCFVCPARPLTGRVTASATAAGFTTDI